MQSTSILAPIILAITHYLGYKLNLKSKSRVEYVRSLSAGFSVSYVLLLLLPEVEQSGENTGIQTPILVLMGFIFFHTALKFVFKNDKLKTKTEFTDIIHISTTAIYNFLITFLAIELIQLREEEGAIIFTIVLVHTVLSEISHKKAYNQSLENIKLPIIIFVTVFAGLLAVSVNISIVLRTALFAFTAGSIMYISIREEIPKTSEGKPLFFLLGSFLFLIVFATL